MLEGVRSLGLDALPWDDDARDFVARCEFVRALGRKRSGGLAGFLARCAGGAISPGSSRFSTASRAARSSARVPLLEALRSRLSYEQQRKLDELAPTHIALPTGSRTRIDYLDDNAPVRVDAHAGSVRAGGHAAHRRRRGAGDVQTTVAGAAARCR